MQKAKLPLTGASNRIHQFEIYPWNTNFNRVGAVYAVLHQTAPTQYKVLYIGQTSDLSERFDNHHKQSCFDKNGKTHLGVLPEPGESNRFNIETDLVRHYNPVCNG
jgi:hypothetical protein